MLASKQLKHFDIWSWHDYHAGWLTDADGIKRMRAMLDGSGGKHLEIWFTEGWAFTNTLVDQPTACTSLTSAQSTNAIMDCVAEITAAGHEKVVMFHTAYETHGQSVWDYSGPGTMLWDWYNNPLPLVAGWNVLNHHIGLSERVGLVQPPGCNFAIFEDLRNRRGVMIAYADRHSKQDVLFKMPISGLVAEDIMGNPVKLSDNTRALSKTGRAVVLSSKSDVTGQSFYKALESLDRRHAGFVSKTEDGAIYKLPLAWIGNDDDKSAGNPILSGGKPVWRIDNLYPADPLKPMNYHPMAWNRDRWKAPDHGGHPSAQIKDGNVSLGIMGPWNGELNFRKIGVLAFIAPEDGQYKVTGRAKSKNWDGNRPAEIEIRKRDTQRAGKIKTFDIKHNNDPVPIELTIDLAAGHELLFLFIMPHHNNATNMGIDDIKITRIP